VSLVVAFFMVVDVVSTVMNCDQDKQRVNAPQAHHFIFKDMKKYSKNLEVEDFFMPT
jgi:hypothetical protein